MIFTVSASLQSSCDITRGRTWVQFESGLELEQLSHEVEVGCDDRSARLDVAKRVKNGEV